MVSEMVNHFARVSGNSLKGYGVNEGQVIYIAGSILVPVAENSAYYRMKFLGAFVVGGHITVTEDQKMFYIDPDNVVLMSQDEETPLIEIRDEDFKPAEQTEAA